MLAWKFFAAGAVAPFTGVPWPLPSESAHAEWVEGAPGDGKGVHACSVEDLPYWFDQELWRVELGGPVTRSGRQLVARRGRLVGRVATWPEAQDEFTRGCIERTRRRVLDGLLQAGRAEDAQRLAAEHELDAQRDAAFAIAASGRPSQATCSTRSAVSRIRVSAPTSPPMRRQPRMDAAATT